MKPNPWKSRSKRRGDAGYETAEQVAKENGLDLLWLVARSITKNYTHVGRLSHICRCPRAREKKMLASRQLQPYRCRLLSFIHLIWQFTKAIATVKSLSIIWLVIKTGIMKPWFKPIIASLFFAGLIIFSALLLKGQQSEYWVIGSIYMSWVYFFFRDVPRKSCLPKDE